jgi:DNA mismatch repair protein MutL
LGQFNVAPILDFDRDANLDTPYHYKNTEAPYPTIQVDGNYNPFAEEKQNKHQVETSKSRRQSFNESERKSSASWESLYVGLKEDTDSISEVSSMQFESEDLTAPLFGDHEVEQQVNKTYQIHRKYIVNPIKSGMVIVDQSRAHQRILYEQFLTNMTVHHASSQQLLFPLLLYFSNNEMELIRELQLALSNTGFVFESTNEDNVVISGIPANVTESEVTTVLEQLLRDLQDGVPESSFSQNDTIAKSMAKSLSVKNGTYLTEAAQENLVNGLFACKEPNVSPFQKPTFITMRVEDLDKKFAL